MMAGDAVEVVAIRTVSDVDLPMVEGLGCLGCGC